MSSIIQKYPHLSTIGLTYVAAVLVLAIVGPEKIHEFVKPLGIGGILLGGMMYTYSFTAGAATIILPSFTLDYNLGFIAVLAALGSTFIDITMLRFIKKDLSGEIKKLSSSHLVRRLHMSWFSKARWLRMTLGFIIVASPFPDEIGIALIASTRTKVETLRVAFFILNLIGIYALVSAGALIY